MKIPEFQYLFNELRNWLAGKGLAGNELVHSIPWSVSPQPTHDL